MAGSLNRVTFIGNVGRDPEIRVTQDGRRIANFSLAMSESWRDRNSGERKERTEWANIVVFNEGLVEHVIEKYVHKGSKLYVEGQYKTRKWTDQSGQDRYSTEVVLSNFSGQIVLLGDSSSNRAPAATAADDYGYENTGRSSGGNYAARHGNPRAIGGGPGSLSDDLSDEIPF